MMKTTLLVFLLLIANLFVFLEMKCNHQRTSVVRPDFELNYYIRNPVGVSIDPLQSDSMSNAIVMKHLVGTLIRYSNGGQFFPYLAEKFRSENDGRVWAFVLKKNLQCQDGESITAQGFIDGLTSALRLYASQGPLPVISDLKGWAEFERGSALSGIRATALDEVTFYFDRTAGPGFLEYLSMPYYGYFCRSNFKNGQWATTRNLVSSGPYQVDLLPSHSRSIDLKLRLDWPLNPSTAPTKVYFSTVLDKESWNQSKSVLQASLGWNDPEPSLHQKVMGPPDLIRSIVLDPFGPSRFFNDIETRKLFRSKIVALRDKVPFRSKVATLAQSFYAGSQPRLDASSLTDVRTSKTLKIYVPKSQNEETLFTISILKLALKELQWPYEIFSPGETPGITPKDSQSRTNFDIRVSSVIAGSVVEPWVVEMMFCSNLGVTYPDPSNRICEYTENLMKESSISFSEAGSEISKIIAEDSALIPIYHGRTTWFFSKDLDVSRLSGDLIIPSFEDIGLKE